jgi:hypothetical protein
MRLAVPQSGVVQRLALLPLPALSVALRSRSLLPG